MMVGVRAGRLELDENPRSTTETQIKQQFCGRTDSESVTSAPKKRPQRGGTGWGRRSIGCPWGTRIRQWVTKLRRQHLFQGDCPNSPPRVSKQNGLSAGHL